MVFKYFKQFFIYFKDFRRAFIKYSFLSIIAGLIELMGVALVYPFILQLVSKSSENAFSVKTSIIGIIIILLFLCKNLYMIFFVHIQTKFLNKFEIALKERIINFYLMSDYKYSSELSIAKKGKFCNLLVSNIINNFIFRLFNLNVNIFVFLLISLCVAIKFHIATISSLLCAYIFIFAQNKFYKPILTKISQKMSELSLINSQHFNEIILNIKGIKISNNEKYFYNNYNESLKNCYNVRRQVNFYNAIPPYIVEPFAIILLFILLFVISYQNYSSPDKLIASFALVATAIFRLTPAISRIQVNLNGINSSLPMVIEFLDLYKNYDISNLPEVCNKAFTEFCKKIELQNISFAYTEGKPILKNLNLEITKGEFIGIAGLSGAGKTTLVDIISGLYKQKSGKILVDGNELKNPLKIGYIPQEFRLISGNIRENVAFGNPNIDDDKVIDALKKAQLYNFISDNYTDGIYANPFVDSTGFSQGQKQRIAIARAMYSNPDILILDEATSSLDIKTEDEICNVLNELKGDKTIIVIAHRLSTIRSADKIIFLKNGEITAIGNYNELIQTSKDFNELVTISFSKKDT